MKIFTTPYRFLLPVALTLLLAQAGPSTAERIEDGFEAIQRGDFGAAY
jgi:hypothetical protein